MKKTYNALIVDDERLARNDLANMLRDCGNINVVGEAEDVASASSAIETLHPDVIFLDIQMPGQSGFDLMEFARVDAKIIFVTAFDEYAIRAFEVNALDYLLKPVNPNRLMRTIERLELEDESKETKTRKLNFDDRLFLQMNNHYKFLKVENILVINSAGDYSEVSSTEGDNGLTQKSLKEWEDRLPENYFCRIHRSTIINMEYIDRLEEWFNYSLRVYLKGIDQPYVISRRYASILKHKLS